MDDLKLLPSGSEVSSPPPRRERLHRPKRPWLTKLPLRFFWLFLPGTLGLLLHIYHRLEWSSHPLWSVCLYLNVGLILGCLFMYGAFQQNSRVTKLLALRESYSPEAFGPRYFTKERAVIATRLRQVFDQHYELNPTRILPSDRFIEDLAFCKSNYRVGRVKIDQFTQAVETEFGIQFDKNELRKILTFKEMVEVIALKILPYQELAVN